MNKLNPKVHPIGGIITWRGSNSSDLKTQRLYISSGTYPIEKSTEKTLYTIYRNHIVGSNVSIVIMRLLCVGSGIFKNELNN